MAGNSCQSTRILVVDDEPDFRAVLALSFRRMGYQVMSAESGRAALDLIRSEPVDVVVSDIRMPNGDGLELLDCAKKMCPTTPIVLLVTGFSEMSTEEAYHKGAEAIFSKPFDTKSLQEAISRLLEPPQERWARQSGRIDVEMNVNLMFQNLTEAIQARVVSLGRGGMFVTLQRGLLPNVNESVVFHVNFKEAGSTLSGTGVVRWVRVRDTPVSPAGAGIEFVYLDEQDRQEVIRLLNMSKPTAYIPNQ